MSPSSARAVSMMTGSSRVSRSRFSARVNSRPLVSGQHPVDQQQVGPLVGDLGAARARVGSFADFEAGAAQPEGDHFADRALVLDDQNLFG